MAEVNNPYLELTKELNQGLEAHRAVTSAAEGTLPFAPGPGGDA